jgi:hypothetical protein
MGKQNTSRFWESGKHTRRGDAAFEAGEDAVDVVLGIVAPLSSSSSSRKTKTVVNPCR